MDLQNEINAAIEKITGGNYAKGFSELAEIFDNGGADDKVIEMLIPAFFEPNLPQMNDNFEKNSKLFSEYPYIFKKSFIKPTDNRYLIFPLDDDLYYRYDKQDRKFIPMEVNSERETKHFFKKLDDPVFAENEYNIHNLKFLADNVLSSEEYAGDNHIYLHYENENAFSLLLYYEDLTELLQTKKFVFLIGDEEKALYPLDHFDVDYSSMTKKSIGISDVKRILFGWKIANASGTSFLADILDFHPDLITIPDCHMNDFPVFYENFLKGKTLKEAVCTLLKMSDDNKQKAFIVNLIRSSPEVSSRSFLEKLENVLAECSTPSPKEWLLGMYLAYSECNGREFSGRIYPTLFVYPHDDMFYLANVMRHSVEVYFEIIKAFPYHSIIAQIRDPITQAGSVARFMTEGHPTVKNQKGERQFDPFYCVAFGSFLPKDYYFMTDHPLFKDMRVVRFEDLKLNSEASFAALAEFANIPVTPSMYKTTWNGMPREGVDTGNNKFDGFDCVAVYRTYSDYLSVFDKYRIELMLEKRMAAYGYEPQYYDGQRFSKNEKLEMMKLPFTFESIPTICPEEQKHASRVTGMSFIKFQLDIEDVEELHGKQLTINNIKGVFGFIPWLRPKEELLRRPLYTNRVNAEQMRKGEKDKNAE